MANLMTGAEIVFKALEDQGVEHIFGYPGGAVLPIYDELKNHKKIKHILVRHEQGAGHAAEGYARSSGKPGVLLVTSGPGATNTVTALTDAYMDSIPLVCITGQVPTHLIGTDAFQECDTTGITRPCTKHNWLVKDVKKLSSIMHKAFEVATTGRPGPVLIDIPKDIQFQKGRYVKPKKVKSTLKLTDNSVWPFLVVAACMGICNAALVQTSSFYFQDVITPNASNPITFASIGFMLMAFGSLIGQLLVADKLRVSPGSLVRYGTLISGISLLCISQSYSLISIYISLFFIGLGQGTQSTGLAASISLSVGQEDQGKANGFMGMIMPIGHVISPLVAMPLYMVSPEYPYLLSGFAMLLALVFIQINARHKWIRKKGYRHVSIDHNQGVEEA